MVEKEPFYSRSDLGKSLNTTFWGDSVVACHPADLESNYESTMQDPDVVLIHGAPDSYEMRTRFTAGESDLIHLYEEDILDDTTMVIFEDEYRENESRVEWMEDNLDVDALIPEENPDTTLEDWDKVEEITSTGDKVRSYTSNYHGFKARKTGEYAIPDRETTVFAIPTDRDSFSRRMIQNTDALTRQKFWSKLG